MAVGGGVVVRGGLFRAHRAAVVAVVGGCRPAGHGAPSRDAVVVSTPARRAALPGHTGRGPRPRWPPTPARDDRNPGHGGPRTGRYFRPSAHARTRARPDGGRSVG